MSLGDSLSMTRRAPTEEQLHLLTHDIHEMAEGNPVKGQATIENDTRGAVPAQGESNLDGAPEGHEHGQAPVYRVYKRRWFGLMQLVLMNIIVSWDVSQSFPYALPQLINCMCSGSPTLLSPTPQPPTFPPPPPS